MLKKTHKDAIRKKDPRNSTWNSPRRAETLPSEELIFTVLLAFLETNYEEKPAWPPYYCSRFCESLSANFEIKVSPLWSDIRFSSF